MPAMAEGGVDGGCVSVCARAQFPISLLGRVNGRDWDLHMDGGKVQLLLRGLLDRSLFFPLTRIVNEFM